MEARKSRKPMNLYEMLPALNGILTNDEIETITAQTKPRAIETKAITSEKAYRRPLLTSTQMNSIIQGLNGQSTKKPTQVPSSRKKKWNSSIKVENKKISHTANGQMRNNPVRKVLNLNLSTKIQSSSRLPLEKETPRFPNPECKQKKPLKSLLCNNVRISGVFAIPDTPVMPKSIKKHGTIGNKENIPKQKSQQNTIVYSSQKNIDKKYLQSDTSQLNDTWKSSCDDSFLQKEREIEEAEDKNNAICEKQTNVNNDLVSPPMSTPFKVYRNVKDYFNDSTVLENSQLYENDTIMCFDKNSPNKQNEREASVIVSLCDVMNKATLANTKNVTIDINNLSEFKKEAENYIKKIDQNIQSLNNIKSSMLNIIESVNEITESTVNRQNIINKINEYMKNINMTENLFKTKIVSFNETCSVIKRSPKSPTFTIPKKSANLRKTVLSKSLLNISNSYLPTETSMNKKALGMYVKMKKNMNFLTTPLKIKATESIMPATPSVTITSNNLKKQLDKLYVE